MKKYINPEQLQTGKAYGLTCLIYGHDYSVWFVKAEAEGHYISMIDSYGNIKVTEGDLFGVAIARNYISDILYYELTSDEIRDYNRRITGYLSKMEN